VKLVVNRNYVIEKTKELIAAQSCFGELKDLANAWLDSVDKPDEKEKFHKYIEYLKGSVSPIDACINFLKSDIGKQVYGDKISDVLRAAETAKASGEDTCICPACQAGKAILNDLK
jgi:hypothetical protein